MKTRKLRKAILTLCSALLLVSLSVGATLAYLTSTDAVVNTFTVGQVKITLDEAPVDANGQETTGDRVKANDYHLLPGHEYDKDPTVHVEANSEDCFVYIRVDNNGIEKVEAPAGAKMADGTAYVTVAQQILNNGWTWVKNENNVHYFYKTVAKATTQQDLEVFSNFMVSNAIDNDTLAKYYQDAQADTETKDKNVTVDAYAVQKDGFGDDYAAAWNATFATEVGVQF